jgi:dTDP-4-dehydrorhamnose reductase
MLGHVVARLLAERGIDVVTSDARYSGAPDDALVEAARESRAEIVVNCLGRIKQKSADPHELMASNALFPLHLVQRLRPDQYLLHASTDCVFAGARGGYRIDDERDAADDYGRSKIFGEGVANWPNASVIRVSIVGPALPESDARAGGLLAWFLAQPTHAPVPGFTNHHWNGITTLDWARIALDLMARRAAGEALPRIVQPGSERVDKRRLLELFRDAFGTAHRIEPVEASEPVDRTLEPTLRRAPLGEQLRELAAWHASGSPLAAA